MNRLNIVELLLNLPTAPEGWDLGLPKCPEPSDDLLILGQVPEHLRPLLAFQRDDLLDLKHTMFTEAAEMIHSMGHGAAIEPELAAKFELRCRRLEILENIFWMAMREHFLAQGKLNAPEQVWRGWWVTSSGNSNSDALDQTPLVSAKAIFSLTGRLLL